MADLPINPSDDAPPYKLVELEDESSFVDANFTVADIGPNLSRKMKQAVIRHKDANDAKGERQAVNWKISKKKELIELLLENATAACNEGKEETNIEFSNDIPIEPGTTEEGIKYKTVEACTQQYTEALREEVMKEFESWGFKVSKKPSFECHGKDYREMLRCRDRCRDRSTAQKGTDRFPRSAKKRSAKKKNTMSLADFHRAITPDSDLISVSVSWGHATPLVD